MSIRQELNYKILSKKEKVSTYSIRLKTSESTTEQMYVIHRALKQQLTNYRIRNAHTKTRSEVKGGGKKPWKQKGTGRARAGSNRSPLWRGGGVIFGPRKKIYRSKINQKENRLAINSVIANKFAQTIVVANILKNQIKPNTKKAISEINEYGINLKKTEKLLLVVKKKDQVLHLSFRNLKNVEIIEAHSINILSLLKADIIMLTYDALLKVNNINE